MVKQVDHNDEIRAMDRNSSNRPSPNMGSKKAHLARKESLGSKKIEPELKESDPKKL